MLRSSGFEMVNAVFQAGKPRPWRFAILATAAALLTAPWVPAAHGSRAAPSSSSASQPPGTITIGPGTLATSSSTTLQNHPTCIGQSCTFVQWSGTAADSSYASPVNGTIVAWRIASGSAGNPVKLRVLRPAGGGKYSAVASSATETTSGSAANPDQFSARIPIRAGDLIGLDNRNSALIFRTGVLGAFPEFWTPALSDGGSPSAPSPPVGTTSNGYQLQIDAYVEPAPTTTSTATTTTASTTTATVSTTTATTTATTPTTDTSLTVGEARVSAVWKASRLTGKVRFTVTVHGASRLNAVLQAPGHGRVWMIVAFVAPGALPRRRRSFAAAALMLARSAALPPVAPLRSPRALRWLASASASAARSFASLSIRALLTPAAFTSFARAANEPTFASFPTMNTNQAFGLSWLRSDETGNVTARMSTSTAAAFTWNGPLQVSSTSWEFVTNDETGDYGGMAALGDGSNDFYPTWIARNAGQNVTVAAEWSTP